MLQPKATTQFKRDRRLMERRGKNIAKLKEIVGWLLAGKPLPARCCDHPLTGEWSGWRDAHVEPDWVLIYKVAGDVLWLARTGTHADLFGK